MTREEFLSSKEYHLTMIQMNLFEIVDKYSKLHDLPRKKLKDHLKVSMHKISELFSGDYDASLENFVGLCLLLKKVPIISFVDLDEFIEQDKLK